ncbi:MAG: GDP-mannose 4,6-dehydratase [Thermodesulfovibrionales bacterium]
MEPILVTGVAGFIGARTAELLLNNGQSVIGIDNMNDYYDTRLKSHRLERLRTMKDFVFMPMDIEDFQRLKALFSDFPISAVINLAARAGVRYSIENPHVYMTTNAIGTLNLLECMKIYGVNKLVLASTSSLYAGHPLPFTEDRAVNQPISPYAASKKSAEVMAYTYHYLYGIDVTVFRYFTVYGPAGRPDMSPFRFIKWISEDTPVTVFGDGTQSRDFTFIDDIAMGTILGLKRIGFEIINLGGGVTPCSINSLIQRIEKLLGKKATVRYLQSNKADMSETMADISKAKELLNWSPVIDLDEGLEKTVKWHIENSRLVREIVP